MPAAEVTSWPITVEHVRITSRRPYTQVRAAIEANLPKLDANIKVMLSKGDQEGIRKYEEHGPKLFMFLERDHGDLLAIVGRTALALRTRPQPRDDGLCILENPPGRVEELLAGKRRPSASVRALED